MGWTAADGLRLVFAGALAALVVPVGPRRAAAAPQVCAGTEVHYHLRGQLRLDHTPLNAGNGVYRVGPGELVLRFEPARGGVGRVDMLRYRLATNYSFTVSLIGMRTTVVVRATARAEPASSGVVASGRVEEGTLTWSTPVRAYRTDGTLTCSGAMCGRFGLPPAGQTRFSDGPAPVHFKPFKFRLGDRRSFSMESTELPRMRRLGAHVALALAGRAWRRRCVSAR